MLLKLRGGQREAGACVRGQHESDSMNGQAGRMRGAYFPTLYGKLCYQRYSKPDAKIGRKIELRRQRVPLDASG